MDTTLVGSTTYGVLVEGGGDGMYFDRATTGNENATSAAGWSIGDQAATRAHDSTAGFTLGSDGPGMIRVNGEPRTATNNPPTSARKDIDLDEDEEYTFSSDDFAFMDTDGDSLASVKIVSLPAAGTLTLSGTAIGSGELPKTVPATELGNLKFIPLANFHGSVLFSFRVNDGTVDSDDSYQFWFVFDSVNDPATGKPGITGTAQVDQTLTATVGTIADADGLPDPFVPNASTTVRWIRVDGTDETDISGATSETYTLATADAGKQIKVKVSFEDRGGHDNGPLTSDAYPSSGTVMAGADTTAPEVIEVSVGTGGVTLGIRFDEALDTSAENVPVSAFSVTAGGEVVTIDRVVHAGSSVILNFAADSAVTQGRTVVLSYTDPTAGDDAVALQDPAGNDVASFTTGMAGVPAVANSSTVAANTAPTGADKTVTTGEDMTYIFTAADFGYDDADDDVLDSVKIETLPGAGALALDGAAMEAGDAATKTRIDANQLTFRPALNAHADAYTTFTFKVNDGMADSDSAYTITIDVTDAPAPGACNAPDFVDLNRRPIWTGMVTAGESTGFGITYYGYYKPGHDSLVLAGVGELDDPIFSIGSNNYEVAGVNVDSTDVIGRLFFEVPSGESLTAGEVPALRLHVCDTDSYDFSEASNHQNQNSYFWDDTGLDWSPPVVTRTLYLSLPANNLAEGDPTISGTATVGQVLTAHTSAITDEDGLTGVEFAYQWLRLDADGTNEMEIPGATAATYTLIAADAGRKVKVRVSFTDELSGEEERTSAAYPAGAATIQAPPAGACVAPGFPGGATRIWTGAVTVGEFDAGGNGVFRGYSTGTLSAVPQSFGILVDDDFIIDGTTYTVENLLVNPTLGIKQFFDLDRTLPSAEIDKFTLYFCDTPLALASVTGNTSGHVYRWQDTSIDWTGHASRTVYLQRDAAAPTLVSASVVGTSLVLTFSEALAAAPSLAGDAFTVMRTPAGGTEEPVTVTGTPAISGNTVTLTLATAVAATDAVTVSYANGSGNRPREPATSSPTGPGTTSGHGTDAEDIPGANATGYTLTDADLGKKTFTSGEGGVPAVANHSTVPPNSAPVFADATPDRDFAENTAILPRTPPRARTWAPRWRPPTSTPPTRSPIRWGARTRPPSTSSGPRARSAPSPASATTTRPRIPTRSWSRSQTARPPPWPPSRSRSPTSTSPPTPRPRRWFRRSPAAPPA